MLAAIHLTRVSRVRPTLLLRLDGLRLGLPREFEVRGVDDAEGAGGGGVARHGALDHVDGLAERGLGLDPLSAGNG